MQNIHQFVKQESSLVTHQSSFSAMFLVTFLQVFSEYLSVLVIQIRRIRMFLGLPDPLVRGTDPDPSIIKQKF
jgi:hypothetical protein